MNSYFVITDANNNLLVPTIFTSKYEAEGKIADIMVYMEENFLPSIIRNELMNTIENNHKIKEIILSEKWNGDLRFISNLIL